MRTQPSHSPIIFVCSSKHEWSPQHMLSKVVHRYLSAPLHENINKWENPLHMDDYYVVSAMAIPYHGYGSIITIVSKEDKTYLMSITNNPQCTCPKFCKVVVNGNGKEGLVDTLQTCVLHFQVFVQGGLCHQQIQSRTHIQLKCVYFGVSICGRTNLVP